MRAMGQTLLGIVALGVMLALMQIWGNAFAPDTFLKCLATLGLVGGVTCYAIILATEVQQHHNRNALLLTGAFCALAALLVLIYMWTNALSLAFLLKALGSLGLLALLAFFFFLHKEDFSKQKDLRDQGYLD
ncbi:MAG: hypothetical protein V4621_04940 [Pseudomonadota bacterium]